MVYLNSFPKHLRRSVARITTPGNLLSDALKNIWREIRTEIQINYEDFEAGYKYKVKVKADASMHVASREI